MLTPLDADSIGVKHHTKPSDYRKYRRKLFRRRNSTGSVEVMHSHAVNLQTSGHQSVVVGHHRGYSQPSTVNTSGDPWFLQAHEMPPTAPARHHKRPAPQPGSILHNNNNNNVGSQSSHQLSQSQQQHQHHHSAVNVSIEPFFSFVVVLILFYSLCGGSYYARISYMYFIFEIFNSQLTSANPLHSSSIALGNPALSLANNSINLSTSNIALEPAIQMASNAHSPKSPNQLVSVQQAQQQAQSQHSHNSTQPISASSGTNTSFRLNLDNSEQIPTMHQNGGSTTGVGATAAAAASASVAAATVTSLHQATPAHVPSAMSTSLHSGSSSTAAGFDAPTTTWNSTSSLSPTNLTSSSSSAQHHRKLEVKLNAMP